MSIFRQDTCRLNILIALPNNQVVILIWDSLDIYDKEYYQYPMIYCCHRRLTVEMPIKAIGETID